MEEISKDSLVIIQYLQFLLPGFLVAWVYYGLTSHLKPTQFERIIQALIFTLVVQALVFGEKVGLTYVGKWWSIRPWDIEATLIASLITALLSGLALSYISNTDRFHRYLRKKGISKRSGYPSEWCGVFSNYPRYAILHFKDGRRLYGWPEMWPSDPEKGHFFLVSPSWLDEEKQIDLSGVEGMLVNVTDIAWVELMEEQEEIDGDTTQQSKPEQSKDSGTTS